MLNKFKYDARQRKILLEADLIILIIASVFAWFNKPFLLGFANFTFSIGLILVVVVIINITWLDHQQFKNFKNYCYTTDNPMNYSTYIKMNYPSEPNVFYGIAFSILLIGIITSLLV